MPTDLSTDLRARILQASPTETAPALAKRFSVCVSTVERLRRRHREGVPLARRQTKFGPDAALTDQDRVHFEGYLAENVSMPQAEMAGRFAADTGRRVSRQTVQRYLQRWKLTRKKSSSAPPSNSEAT